MTDRAPSRAAFIFVFITVALDMLALGIIVPVLPKLIIRFEAVGARPWSALSLAAIGVCSAIVAAALVGPVVARLGERRSVLCGLAFGLLGFAVYGLAPTGGMFLAGAPLLALWGLAGPATQALLSRRVGPSEQGQLQGAVSSIRGITGMIGPLLFTQVFAAAVSLRRGVHAPGAPYMLAALLLAAALYLAWHVTRPRGATIDARVASKPD